MATYSGPDDLSGTEFIETNFAGSVFREVDLSGVRIRGALLNGADLDGVIDGLRVNGVEVAPLVEAELDRLHPERTRLRPSTPDGMRIAWKTVEAFWAPTMARAGSMPEQDVHRSVDGEWSFVQTLRHLVMVTDLWFGQAVLGRDRPYHPLGLPAAFITNGADLGMDLAAEPSLAEVAAVRADRMAEVREFLVTATQEDLDRVREPEVPSGWPSPAPRAASACLRVIFNEEWAHHSFAVRDLDTMGDSKSAI
ncbi:DinB family protein [Dactylosporangium sp. NPDC050588]|uniref:DinB family protein n=1 Tax=Dactylosporangium sp. NPDC050588 TaxID=3157211 RepID=UPI003400F87D